jgi:hypothetical protein
VVSEVTVAQPRIVVNRKALRRALGRAAELGVGRGGVYDVRGSALVVWAVPWMAIPLRPPGDPIGMISWTWGEPDAAFATIDRVEAAAGHTPDSILNHLQNLLVPATP